MSSITLTPNTAQSFVRLDADFSDVVADVMAVQRTRLDTGGTAFLRAAGPTSAVSGVYLGLNANPDFESSSFSWTSLGGATISRSTTQKHRGAASLQIITVATAGPGAESEKDAVIAGQLYGYSVWVYNSSNTLGMSAGINWYNASGGLVSSSLPVTGTVVTLPVGWTLLQDTAGLRAPAGATQATVVCQNVSGVSLGSGVVFYIDEARLLQPVTSSLTTGILLAGGVGTTYDVEMPLDTPVSYTATGYYINGTRAIQVGQATAPSLVVVSAGLGWLKDPLVPANSIQLQLTDVGRPASNCTPTSRIGYLGTGTETAKANASAFTVNSSAYPSALWRQRSAPTNTLLFSVRSLADRTAMRNLLTTGNPVLLQLPAAFGEADRYFLFQDSAMDKLGQDERRPYRVFSLPAAQILAPSGAAQGIPGTRFQDMCNAYSSWGTFQAGASGVYDMFGRTVGAGSWGTPDTGPAYTLSGTASNFSISGGSGIIALNSLTTPQYAYLGNVAAGDLLATVIAPVVATGSYYETGFIFRRQDASNYLRCTLKWDTTSLVSIILVKTVAGTDTTLATSSTFGYFAGSTVRIHLTYSGSNYTASIWSAKSAAEPATPTLTASDGSITASGSFGLWARANTGNTNTLSINILWDDFIQSAGATWTQVADGVTV